MANTRLPTVEIAVIKRCNLHSLHTLTLQSSICSCSAGGKKKIPWQNFLIISKLKAQQQLLKHFTTVKTTF